MGATVIEVPVGQDGLVDRGLLEQARTSRTRAVVIANPSNPSGVLHPPALICDIADWCLRNEVWLISDEVYGCLVYDTPPFSATSVVTDPGRLIVVDGVSKVHAMTGWRVGWLLGPQTAVAAARRQVAATITHVPTLTQQAALAASTPRYPPRQWRTTEPPATCSSVDCRKSRVSYVRCLRAGCSRSQMLASS